MDDPCGTRTGSAVLRPRWALGHVHVAQRAPAVLAVLLLRPGGQRKLRAVVTSMRKLFAQADLDGDGEPPRLQTLALTSTPTLS